MKILLLTRYSRLGASSRLRTLQYIPYLQNDEISIDVSTLFDDQYLTNLYSLGNRNWFYVLKVYFLRALDLFHAKSYDLLWIEKELFPWLPSFAEYVISKSGVPYVVDYDDAIFHNYDLSTNPFKKLLSKKINNVMLRSSLVVCGNDYLAERASLSGATNVEVIPTVVDINRYVVEKPKKRNHLVIGWVGTPSTVKYLNLVIPALITLSSEISIELRVIGANFKSMKIPVHCRPWLESTEVAEINDFDIGIMPLFDTPWERGKCSYKLIQYMACAKPVIASDVGANKVVVKHLNDGFLVNGDSGWLSAIKTLNNDAKLRNSMGLNARKKIIKEYSLQVTAPRLIEMLNLVIQT